VANSRPESALPVWKDAGPKLRDSVWVVKLGGSLLNQPDFPDRLRALVRENFANPLLIVGGGSAADVVRRWEEIHGLSASAAHGLAVPAMDFNRHLLEAVLPEAVAVTTPKEAMTVWQSDGLPVLEVSEWLRAEQDETQESLPSSWDVTSDSIAAWTAIRWRAAGLLLLKSVDPPQSASEWDQAVDDYFPNLAPELLELAWCNLQSARPEIKLGNVKDLRIPQN